MSYDIELVDKTGKVIEFDQKHSLRGGTFALGGTQEAWLNITYNYAEHFHRVLPERNGVSGIRSIYGLTGEESIPILDRAIEQLGDDVHEDYWEPTEGNAKQALMDLRALATMAPHGVWAGD